MNMNNFPRFLQAFSFTVRVNEVGELQEFEITVKQKSPKPAPIASATGNVVIDAIGKKKAAFPVVTRVRAGDVQTYTFRLSPSDLGRSRFTFTETPQDTRVEFPSPGDYWVFELNDFVANPRK